MTSKEEIAYGDPFEHIRAVGTKTGWYPYGGYYGPGSSLQQENALAVFEGDSSVHNLLFVDLGRHYNAYLALSYDHPRLQKDTEPHRSRFIESLRAELVRNPALSRASFETLTMNELGSLLPYLTVRLALHEPGKRFYLKTRFKTDEGFVLDRHKLDISNGYRYINPRKGEVHKRELFGDIEELHQHDFRPYFHRGFELIMNTPKKQWHDPRFYLPPTTAVCSTPAESVSPSGLILTKALTLLFPAEERTALEQKVRKAKLSLNSAWQSVPRFNLGPIKVPSPGRKDACTDEFVIRATPYLVEYLSAAGTMPVHEAETLVGQRLTNYFLHRSGFQLSREKAEKLLSMLGSSSFMRGKEANV